MKQLSLLPLENKTYYGGSLVKGKRKMTRPLCSQRPIHLVLKSQKSIDLFVNKQIILGKINLYAQKFGIKIYDISVQRDHIHLSVRIQNREQYKKFVRSFTGVLARHFGPGMWKLRPFTRVLEWGRDFAHVRAYIEQNELEVHGVIPYQARGQRSYG